MEAELTGQGTALYRLFDAASDLLYVGIAYEPERRWASHAYTKAWWHLVARKEVRWFARRSDAEAAERLAVQEEHPRFDATHRTGGNWKTTPRVTYIDPRSSEINCELRALVQGLANGEAVPSMSSMAAQYGTSIATIDRMLEALGKEKLISRAKRRWRRVQQLGDPVGCSATQETWRDKLPDRKPVAYQAIADDLRAAIKDGTAALGSKLPSEAELMEQYNVARGTVREALSVLRAEGLVEARRGAGVFVRSFQTIIRNATKRLSSSVWGVGRPIWAVDINERPMTTANLRVEEVTPPDRIAACFGLAPGETVWMRDRDYLVEGRAVQRATSYLPSSIVAGSAITQPDSGPGGTYARLAELGYAPAKFREELQVRMPVADEAARLGLGAGTPVVLIARTAFDKDNRPVEVNEMLLDASSYVLQYDFTA